MNNYFKYTSGESFTLNDRDYYGFFHITDNGDAYTNRLPSNDSLLLTKKSTFLSDVYTNKIELNTAYKNIEQPILYYSNVFDNFNKEGLLTLSKNVNNNNLIALKSLVIDNPTIYNFDPQRNHFYGIPYLPDTTSTELIAINTSIPVDQFKNNLTWKFLNNITTGDFFVKKDNTFTYICSDGTKIYYINGGFSFTDNLDLESETNLITEDSLDYVYNIVYDESSNKLTIVKLNDIIIYDASNYINCSELFIIDRIKLPYTSIMEPYIWNKTKRKFSSHRVKWNTRYYIDNLNNSQFIKFGNNLRTFVYNNVLTLYNKYSSDIIYTIDLSIYGVKEIVDLDIRQIDDNIIVLCKKDSGLYVLCIDVLNLSTIIDKKLESVLPGMPWYRISFSNIDSDIFYLSDEREYQIRHLSYPNYPTGRLEFGNLLYREDYIWSEVEEYFSNTDVTWNLSDDGENEYFNILSLEKIRNNNMYIILHNKSRLYAIFQPLEERLSRNISPNIEKFFTDIGCSESSIGLFFNTIISNIVKDTLNLYNKASGKYSIDEYIIDVIPLEDIEYDSNNLYINGNETFNAMVLQRILSSLRNIQAKLISVSES